MKNVLIVERDRSLAGTLQKKIAVELGLPTRVASSLGDIRALVTGGEHGFFIAVVDISAGDPADAAASELISAQGLSSILITGEFSEKMSEWMLSRYIVDYVVREDGWDVDYIVRAVRRVYRNQSIKVLVADDSKLLRAFIRRLLTVQRYRVLEACDGVEALEQLGKHPDIKLIITDFQMPRMDGFKLTAEVRKTHHFNQLAIVGISAHGSGLFSAKFLKKGANDFLTKPFLNEEFNCRINQNIEMLETIEAVKEASNRDYLTGFFNRRQFFELGQRRLLQMDRRAVAPSMSMMDIDRFKLINDRYGHQAGDRVLQHVSRILADAFSGEDIVCRFGGDEFCVMSMVRQGSEAGRACERIRRRCERDRVDVGHAEIPISLSFGVVKSFRGTLEDAIHRADELLYQAKKSGRNKVVVGS